MLINRVCIVACSLLLVLCGDAQAGQGLKIVSPVGSYSLQPGSTFEILAEQTEVTPSPYFNGYMAAVPEGLFERSEVLSRNPYRVRVKVASNVKPGGYGVRLLAANAGGPIASDAFHLRIGLLGTVRIEPDMGGSILLRFPGDQSMARLIVYDGSGAIMKAIIGQGANVSFQSEDESVAVVDQKGLILGLKSGSTRVVATLNGMMANFDVSVLDAPSLRGDFNGDRQIDMVDIEFLQDEIGAMVRIPSDPRDLNGDGKIDSRDVIVLRSLCTRPDCSVLRVR